MVGTIDNISQSVSRRDLERRGSWRQTPLRCSPSLSGRGCPAKITFHTLSTFGSQIHSDVLLCQGTNKQQTCNWVQILGALVSYPITKHIPQLPKVIFVCLHSVSNLQQSEYEQNKNQKDVLPSPELEANSHHFVLSFSLFRINNGPLQHHPEEIKNVRLIRSSVLFTSWQNPGNLS